MYEKTQYVHYNFIRKVEQRQLFFIVVHPSSLIHIVALLNIMNKIHTGLRLS